MSDDILELPSNNDKSKNNRENGLMHLFAILDTMKIKYDFPPNGKSNFINNRIGIYGDYELNISINDYTVDMKQLCSHLNKELMKYGCHVSRDNYNTMTLKYDSSLLVKEQEFKSYNTIVFDIGGVLIEREKIDYKVIERNLGIIDDIEFRELMMLYYGIANKHDNLKYSEIVELYKAVLPDRFKNKAEKLIDVALAKKVCKYTYHLLQQLKEKGYKLYYLSNATRHRHEIYKKKGLLDFLKYFDGGLLSYLEGVEKPDPEFYKRLINKYKLNPSNCLFIDDNENNINTAKQLKFNTLHYNNPNKINLYSIIESVIFETAWKSKVDNDFKPNGYIDINKYKMQKVDQAFLNKYKKDYNMLKHVDLNDNTYCWMDGDKIVALLGVDPSNHDDNKIWITIIEITNDYRGYGLSNQLLKYAVNNLGANALGVYKDNEIAIKTYKNFGFKISPESQKEVDSGKTKQYKMYLESTELELPEDNTLAEILDNTSPDNIYLTSDWHLFKNHYKDEKNYINTQKIISWCKQNIKDNDVFFYLGDISYRWANEEDKEKSIKIMSSLPGIKVLILGNHGTMIGQDYFTRCGFRYIFNEYRWQNFIFTHKPIDMRVYADNLLNIHGHIHNVEKYNTTNGEKNINVYPMYYNNKPVTLDYIINHVDELTKDHSWNWNAGYDEATVNFNSGIFNSVIELNNKLSNMQYGILMPGYTKIPSLDKRTYNTTASDWDKYYRLASPTKFIKQNGGTCWDYVCFEDFWLDKYTDLNHACYYIESRVSDDLPTHTICIFEYNDIYYYIESSFKRIIGVYYSNSINDLISFSLDMMDKYSDCSARYELIKSPYYVYQYKANDTRMYDMSCVAFMQHIYTNGKKINFKYNPNYKISKYAPAQISESKRSELPEDEVVNEACKDVSTARRFVSDVRELAKKYDANFFVVTDGASGYSNGNGKNNPAVKNARAQQIEWEKKNGFDPDEDWEKKPVNEAKRSELPDSSFGIPEDRKYPLDTEQHVKSAIKLFGHAEESKKKYLAKRINTAAKKYDISIPETTQCYKYLSEGGFYDMIPEDVTTIVFDMENVLVGSDIEGTIHRALTINHTLIHQISDILIDDIISCEPKDKGIKNGTVEYAKKYFNSIVPEIVLQYTDLIFNLLNDALFKYSYVDELIASFKTKGYMVYYLSNWMGWTYELQKEFFGPLISKFDGGLFSFETNYEKPQEEFYRLFFEKFHLDPEKCFFFDDKSENISAAERVGMRGMIFNHEETPKQLLAGNFDIPSNANNKILVSTGVNLETMNIKSIKKWYCCNNPKPCSIDENLFCKTLESAIKLYVQEYELDSGSIEKYVFTTNGTIHENGGLTMIPIGCININPDYTYEWNIQYPLIKEENGILSSGLTEWSMAACNPIKGISKPFLVKIVPDYNSTINPAMYAFSPDIVSDKYLVINENAELEIVDSNKFKDCTIESYEFIGDNKEYLVNKIYKAYQEHKIVDNTFFYTTLTGKPMLCEDQIEYDKLFHKVDYDLMVENIITELVTFKENVIKCIYNTNTTLPVLESVANIAPSLKGYKNIFVKTDIDGYYYNNTLTKKRSRSVENISELSEAMLMSTL